MHSKGNGVLAIVMSFNLFMNAVYGFDKLRASHMTAEREAGLAIPISTFLLDASIQNEYALYWSVKKADTEIALLKEFKQRVAKAMVDP